MRQARREGIWRITEKPPVPGVDDPSRIRCVQLSSAARSAWEALEDEDFQAPVALVDEFVREVYVRPMHPMRHADPSSLQPRIECHGYPNADSGVRYWLAGNMKSARANQAAYATCVTFAQAFTDLPTPSKVQVGALLSEPGAPKQAAHCDQTLKAGDRWQGLVTLDHSATLLVYKVHDGELWEVTTEVPPHHLLAFHGRLLHAGAGNDTSHHLMRGFIYFHGWSHGWGVDFNKVCGDVSPEDRWGFADLCWQQGLDIQQCNQLRIGRAAMLPKEVTTGVTNKRSRGMYDHEQRPFRGRLHEGHFLSIVRCELMNHECDDKCVREWERTKQPCILRDMGARLDGWLRIFFMHLDSRPIVRKIAAMPRLRQRNAGTMDVGTLLQ
jgi:hypothetical protein